MIENTEWTIKNSIYDLLPLKVEGKKEWRVGDGGREKEGRRKRKNKKKGKTGCPHLHSVLLSPLHFFSALTCTSDPDFLSDSNGLAWLLYKLVHLLWSLRMLFTSAILNLFLSSNCPLLATVSKKTMCSLLKKWGMALRRLPSCPAL